jgi:hypothetical protein
MDHDAHYQAAYRERYGDLDALAREAFHRVPPVGDPMRRPRLGSNEPPPPITPDQAWRNLCALRDTVDEINGDRGRDVA